MKVYSCLQLFLMFAMMLILSDSVAQTRPNIVFILTDDQGWGDLSIHGNTNVKTPNIDKLARDGARFARFYVAPLCAPTRAGLLTGRYHYRGGVYGVSNSKEYLNTDEVTFADLFKKAGYATGCFGKWHNGSQYPYHPNGRGFDEFYGFLSGHYANYFNTMLDHNGEAVRSTGFITDDLTDKAIGFIEKNKAKPFVCYIPYNAPHSPFQVPDEYYDRVKKRGITKLSQHPDEEDLETTISALAMCENIDWNVGRILKKLDDLKLAKNTIVIYMTDNGPSTWRWNGDMKGKKATAEEGGVRVPFFVRWPGTIAAGKIIQDNAAYIDILPTLAELAGISKAGTKPLDGISLKSVIVGASTLPGRLLFTSINKKNSVRKWPYLLSESGLYDLSKDSTQQTNLAATQPEVFKTLSGALDQWYKDVTKNADTVRWLPIGFAQFPKATLPSQDAHLHRSKGSSLSYSASAPNSSWITNWTDTTSFVTWDIDVNTTGTYKVNVLYTCSDTEIGSKFSIHFGSKHLQGSFDEAFNPPLIPSPDRVKRKGESYEKEFKRKQLAHWTLGKGKGQIRLKADELKGARFADIKAIELELLK